MSAELLRLLRACDSLRYEHEKRGDLVGALRYMNVATRLRESAPAPVGVVLGTEEKDGNT